MDAILPWQIWRMRHKFHYKFGQHDEWKMNDAPNMSSPLSCVCYPCA
jgi:hypothetical protein